MHDPQDDFSRRLEELLRRADEQRKARLRTETADDAESRKRYAHPAQAIRARLGTDRLSPLDDPQ